MLVVPIGVLGDPKCLATFVAAWHTVIPGAYNGARKGWAGFRLSLEFSIRGGGESQTFRRVWLVIQCLEMQQYQPRLECTVMEHVHYPPHAPSVVQEICPRCRPWRQTQRDHFATTERHPGRTARGAGRTAGGAGRTDGRARCTAGRK
jgi:hypothetical protein